MLEQTLVQAYDRARVFTNKPFHAVCYAPFNSMYLDTYGLVRACCVNRRYVLGDLKEERLDDIWFGARAKMLRDAMKRYDLLLGCEFCEWQIRNGNFTDPREHQASVHARKYDQFKLEEGGEGRYWPTNLEFNLSNTCNLECVTCNGEFSSSIRARRENLPPLPRPYADSFFEDLEKYLAHVRTAQFLGGEPFLIVEHFRVWERMAAQDPMEWVGITTNGTIYNDRVQRVLDTLPVSITMSMDGVTKETFESIRVNASYEVFMANFRRFLEYHRARRKRLGFNFTLSRLNHHEFADFVLFADSYGCDVNVCTLVSPAEMSLYTLEAKELARVIAALESRNDEMLRHLTLNQVVWTSAVANLRHELERSHQALPVVTEALAPVAPPTEHPIVEPEPVAALERIARDARAAERPSKLIDGFKAAAAAPAEAESTTRAQALARLREWSGCDVDEVESDVEDVIRAVHARDAGFLGLGVEVVGRTLDELRALLVERFGRDWRVTDVKLESREIDRIMELGDGAHRNAWLRVVILPRFRTRGDLSGLRVMMARRPVPN